MSEAPTTPEPPSSQLPRAPLAPDVVRGIVLGVLAYGSWGLFPLYFKCVANVEPLVILAHRALWSALVLLVANTVLRRFAILFHAARQGRVATMLALSTLMIAVNWLAFIYAVVTNHVLQSSLGYFLTPLANVLLGVLFLGERLNRRQVAAVLLATTGVLLRAVIVGHWPWIAILLAATFSLYGLLRKTIPLDGLAGLTAETLALAPLAIAYLGWRAAAGGAFAESATSPPASAFGAWPTLALLALSGPVTTLPLLCFAAAARRLRLSTIGFIQYLTPTLQFLCAVLFFGERLDTWMIVSFGLIWVAVFYYCYDAVQRGDSAAAAASEMEPD